MQEEVTQKTVTFCDDSRYLKEDTGCISETPKAEADGKESTEESAETGEDHGKRVGKTECRDGQYRDNQPEYQIF